VLVLKAGNWMLVSEKILDLGENGFVYLVEDWSLENGRFNCCDFLPTNSVNWFLSHADFQFTWPHLLSHLGITALIPHQHFPCGALGDHGITLFQLSNVNNRLGYRNTSQLQYIQLERQNTDE